MNTFLTTIIGKPIIEHLLPSYAYRAWPILVEYYQLFQQKKEAEQHNLRLATIYSYQTNEPDKDTGEYYYGDEELFEDPDQSKSIKPEQSRRIAADPQHVYKTQHTRDHLENFIGHYNKQFGTNYTTKDSRSFYNYYNDVAKRVKHRQVDILLVVNMFLTGFDSKTLNTLYVDKNLRYHGLIQAYSRTNRILDELKSQGNIVCFRNLKKATDEAITLFSNIEAKEEIIIQPYEDYVAKFNHAFQKMLEIVPTVDSVNDLPSEDEELAFIKAFRELMRLKNVLGTFTEFDFDDLTMAEQAFEDYKSKYLDLYDKARSHRQKEKVSILGDVDFELELIHRDEVNVSYILKLLAKLKDAAPEDQDKQRKALIDLVAGETQLRSKRELIEKFITQNLPNIEDSDDIPDEFESFWNIERKAALARLSEEEQLHAEQLQDVIGDYLFTEKKPLRDDIINIMKKRPGLRERKTTAERITGKIIDFVETFISGVAG